MKSGLQKQVLDLYKRFLIEIPKKPIENRANFKLVVKSQFKKDSKLAKTEFEAIEYLIRKGEKQLTILKNPNCESINL